MLGTAAKSKNRPVTVLAKRAGGSVESFNHDGYELARFKPRRRGLPLRQIGLFIVAVIAFKVFLNLDMGGSAYGAKVDELLAGSTLERVAGRVMAMDPVTQFVVGTVRHGVF